MEMMRMRACETFSALKHLKRRGDIGQAIAAELGRLSIFDLQRISACMEADVDKVPSPYREKVRPYFTEQLFGSYFRLMRMHGDGTLKAMDGRIKDEKAFEEYCLMAMEESEKKERGQYGWYYYLVSCFTMFVLEEPGHPVGMPFPGGFIVERRGDNYYCPIREKEKDVPFAICNFCPALQGEIS
jgi:uncharacterized protein (UPF0305 family)